MISVASKANDGNCFQDVVLFILEFAVGPGVVSSWITCSPYCLSQGLVPVLLSKCL